MLNNHMRTFKQFVEDKDHMAKGISVANDPKMAKEIIWLAVGEGMDKNQISQHIASSIPPAELAQAGGYSPRAVDRALSGYGLNSANRNKMAADGAAYKQKLQVASNKARDNRKEKGIKYPVRSAGTARTQDQIRSAHHAKRADLAAQAQQPQMPPNQINPRLAPQSAFDLNDLKRQGRAAS